jgi:hypothetical protein
MPAFLLLLYYTYVIIIMISPYTRRVPVLLNMRPAEWVMYTTLVLGATPLYLWFHQRTVALYTSREELNAFTAWILPGLLSVLTLAGVVLIFSAYMWLFSPIRWEVRRSRRQLQRV